MLALQSNKSDLTCMALCLSLSTHSLRLRFLKKNRNCDEHFLKLLIRNLSRLGNYTANVFNLGADDGHRYQRIEIYSFSWNTFRKNDANPRPQTLVTYELSAL